MIKIPGILYLCSFLGIALLLGCTSNNQPAGAIQSYLQALADKDSDQLAQLSCAEWEAQSKTDLESFGAVSVSLEDPQCKENGEEGGFTLISCTGKMIANYGNEILEIDLSDRTYLASFDGGEWRMCGYR